jgi:hypothetical protein
MNNDLFDWLPPLDMSEEAEERRARMWQTTDVAFAVQLLVARDRRVGLIEESPLPDSGDECPF